MDKELRVKIKINSETAKLDTLNSKINDTSKGFNNADSMVSTFTSKLDSLNGKVKTAFDSKPIDDLVKRTLNPYGTKLDEINKKWQTNLLIMQRNGGNTSGVFAAWNKEISDLETSKLDALNNKVNNLSKGFDNTSSMASAFTNRILMLGGAYLTLNAAIDGGKKFIQQADTMKSLDSRLKLATDSLSEYNSQQKELTKISLDSHTAISDSTTLFTKLNPALKQVGASTGQVDTVVGSFTKGLQLGGATAAESSSAILQFSQAMGSGVLRGEEFNAMAEASPKLMEYMAKGLGVPQTALRKMAEDGELTAVKVSNALLSVKTDIERDFKTMPVIVEKAMTDLSTYMSLGIRDIDNATGASTALSGAIIDFGKNIGDISGSVITFYQDAVDFTKKHNEALDTTGTILKTVTAAYIGFAVTSGIATGIGAITTSVYALRTSILVLQTSIPIIGWVAAAVGTAAGAYVLANDMMDESNNKAEISTDRLKEKIKELEDRKASLAQNKFKDSNEKTINLEIEALQSKLKLQEQFTKKQIQSNTNIIPVAEKTAVTELIGEYEGYAKTIDKITEKKKTFSELTKELQKEIDPVRAIKEEYTALRKSIKGTEADTPEYNKKINENELEAIAKLDKEKISKAKDTAKKIAEVESEFNLIGLNDWDTKFKELENKYNADLVKYQDVVGAKEKLDLVYAGKVQELSNQRNIEAQKEDLSYFERKIQLMDDSISKELELQGVSYANRILEIENTTKSIAEKDKLIAKETELFNLTVQTMNYKYDTEFKDTMSNFYDDMLDSQIALNNAVFDFGSGFDGVSNKIGGVSKSLAAMSTLELTNKKEASKLDKKYIEQFNKYAGDVDKTKTLEQQYTKDTALLNEKNIQAQIEGYANIAGAMANSFDEGSRAAEIFTRAQATAAMIAGTTAVLKAAEAPPPIGFASMLGMAATVTTILANAGIAFGGIGGTKTTTTSDAFSSMEVNTGTGSVLGDVTAQSESISNSLGILQDFAQPQFQVLTQMNKYLESIDQKIGGVSSLLIQNGGFAFGDGYTGFDTGYSNNINWGKKNGGGALLLQPIDSIISKIPVVGEINSMFGSIMNTVLGGLFGKTSVSQSLTDSGIYFADTLLTSAIKQFDGEAYQTISTTVSKKSWFSKSSSTSINSYFDELDNETERQFSLVLDNLYSTTLLAGNALDSASSDTAKSLENYIVNIGKISLKDKTGSQIQELLTSIFGKVGDDIAKTAFPALTPFQQIGEGLFTTMTRVATGMETADYYISRLGNRFDDVIYTAIGNKQGDVGFEALLQSIQAVEVATYPANNNLYKIVENLDATAEELYSMYTNLDELRDRLIFLKQDAQALSNSMIYGAGNVSALDDGFQAYFENFLSENEQLTFKTQQLIKEFNNLGIALPTSKDGFKDLLNGIDKTSESGQELYGRLIILSEEFAGVADETTSSIDAIKTSLTDLSTNAVDTFLTAIESVNTTLESIKGTATSFLQGLTTSSNASLEDQLIAYNKLRSQFSNYFDANGNILSGVNQNDVTSLYSQISTIANNIAGKDTYLKDSLAAQFQNDINSFNASEDIIKVNIVAGLGSLENLTEEQKNRVNALIGTTATEDTLYSLNEYIKKQLEVLQTTQEQETAALSSQTFTYGDYVGLEEQRTIASLLGISYDTAQPLIQQLQNLSISKNPTADIQSILGYKAGSTTYDTTKASQLVSLSPYISGLDIAGTISGVQSNIEIEKAKQEQIRNLESQISYYNGLLTDPLPNYFANTMAEAYQIQDPLWREINVNAVKNQIATWTRDFSPTGEWNGGQRDHDLIPVHNSLTAQYQYAESQQYQPMINQLSAQIKTIRGYKDGSPNIIDNQLAWFNKSEIVTPPAFSDGIRSGELSLTNNNEMVKLLRDIVAISLAQGREIKKTRKLIEEQNLEKVS